MAHMKEFAVWLSKCIYILKLTDEEIIDRAKTTWNITDEAWIRAQIHAGVQFPVYAHIAKQS